MYLWKYSFLLNNYTEYLNNVYAELFSSRLLIAVIVYSIAFILGVPIHGWIRLVTLATLSKCEYNTRISKMDTGLCGCLSVCQPRCVRNMRVSGGYFGCAVVFFPTSWLWWVYMLYLVSISVFFYILFFSVWFLFVCFSLFSLALSLILV